MPWYDKYKQVADNTVTNISTPTGKSIVTDNSPYTQNQFLSLMEGMPSGVQYDRQQKQNRISQRKNAELAVDKNQPFTLPSGKTKKFSDMDFREKRYVEGVALENRGRIFPNEESLIDDLNPLNWIASMAGNMSKAPYEAKQQDSYIPYLTSVGTPLAVGALGSIGAKTTGQFVNNVINPFAGTGDLVNNLGNKYLPNAYKYNPWAFKPNPEAYYHRSPNLENIINKETGVLQGFGQSEAGKIFNETAGPRPGMGINLKKPANNRLFYSKGTPLDYGRYNPSGQGYEGPFMIELNDIPMLSASQGKTKAFAPTNLEAYAVTSRPVNINEANFYKEDWLKGYKQIPKSINK